MAVLGMVRIPSFHGASAGVQVMRPAKSHAVDRLLLCVAAVFVLAAAAMGGQAVARADTLVDEYVAANGQNICAALDVNPTVEGVEEIGTAIMADGLAPEAAGEIVGRSIIGFCPEHAPVLQAFIDKWTTARYKA